MAQTLPGIHARSCAILLLCLALLPLRVFPQIPEVKFEHRSIEQGLSQSTVNAVVEDAQGFLWFGTQDGLNKFDGYTIRVFRHHPSDSTSISDNGIWCLARGNDNDLWIGTMRGGLNRYELRSESFSSYRHSEADTTSISDNNVTALLLDSRGRLWIGTLAGGLNLLIPGSTSFTHFLVPPRGSGLQANTIWSIVEGNDGSIWVAEWGALLRLLPDGKTWVRFVHDPKNPNSLAGDEVRALLMDHHGKLWVGTWGAGLDEYDPTLNVFRHFVNRAGSSSGLSSNLILSIGEDSLGTMWVGTGDAGLDRLDSATGRFDSYHGDPAKRWTLSSDIITALYTDNTGDIWIGTGAGGVNLYNRWRNRFPHYRDDRQESDHPHGNDVWAIETSPEGVVWVGTYGGGLLKLNRREKTIEHFEHDSRQLGSLTHNSILSLCRSRDGALWIGTEGGGLDCLLPGTKTFVHYRHSPNKRNSLAQDEVTAILEDRSGKLWIGTNGVGLDCLDRSTNTFTHFLPNEKDPHGLSAGSIMALQQTRDGRIWVGTWGGGLDVLDPQTGEFARFTTTEGGLSNNTVLSIYEDASGMLWLGTYGGGLNHFDPHRGTISVVSDASGLPNNVIYGVLPDQSGSLWLTTNLGLARYTPESGMCRVYDADDGLQGNEFNQGAYHRSATGELFVGGANGLNAFYPQDILDNEKYPPVYLTSFRIFDKPAKLSEAVSMLHSVALGYDQNFFSFEFVALDFTSPTKNRYAYKLEGLDQSWIEAGTRRFASYTNLDPGHYVFRWRGSNSDGVWNQNGGSVELEIEPPYWKTWWFRVVAVAAAFGALFLLYRMRVNKLIAIERIRTSIATDLHDDIGSTLTEIALFSEVGKRLLGRNGKEEFPEHERLEALKKLEEIGGMARNLIDAMSDIVWSVNPKNDTVESLMLRMRTHATKVLEAKGITYDLSFPESLPQYALQPAVRRGLFMIYKEAVNNIVKHSNATAVRLGVSRDRSLLGLSIVDNGKGFISCETGQGNGLNNMQSRARSLGGDCAITSKPGAGTTISVKLPMK